MWKWSESGSGNDSIVEIYFLSISRSQSVQKVSIVYVIFDFAPNELPPLLFGVRGERATVIGWAAPSRLALLR